LSTEKEEMMSKVWLITGSALGLGRKVAEIVLANGDRLIATARASELELLAELKKKYGEQVELVTLDVTDGFAAQKAVQVAVDTFGRLDVLLNNAGFGNVSPFEQQSIEDFKAQIDTNFYGVVNTIRAAVPIMREQRSGHIINISSVAGRIGAPGQTAYHAAKFAVGGFTESLAKELAVFGVKAVVVEPGGMRTNWAQFATKNAPSLMPDYEPSVGMLLKIMEANMGKDFGDPEKIAQVIFDLSRKDDLPIHLILGSDSLFAIDSVETERSRVAAKWEHVSRSTDFNDVDLSMVSGHPI
jgi:NAD(P)-dependent dehydrogenase (short-subunit alcohol dehydrogenase family)